MATLLMPSDHHQQQRRAKSKAKNGQKKQPQRGLGVAQLEKLRMQEESKKVMLASSLIAASSSSPRPSIQHQHPLFYHHPQLQAAAAAAAFQPPNKHSLMNSLNLNAYHLPVLKTEHQPLPDHFPAPRIKQPPADSGSCKSGISCEKPPLAAASPSPCSSQHNSPPDEAGDESSKISFLTEGMINSGGGSGLIKNTNLILSNLITKEWGIPPSADSEMFDPSFRTRKRVYDCRDWPGVYGVPAIKELSSFQIPGNTHPALSSANRTRSSCCEGPWSGVREGIADMQPVKIIGSASSPTSFSSWPRSEVCFSFDGTTTKDSCSSSFNLNNNLSNNSNNNNNNSSLTKNLEAKARDFLALSLSTSAQLDRLSRAAALDDGESCSNKIVNDQEASGETDEDYFQPIKVLKLNRSVSPRCRAVTLELSLNVAAAAAPADDSSLELKLAL